MPLLVAGTNLLVLPAAVVALGAVVVEGSTLRRSAEAALLPAGVALVAGGVVAVANLLSGDPLLGGAGVVAFVLLTAGWVTLQRARSDEHAAWADGFAGLVARDRRLHARRDALRNAPTARPDQDGDHDPEA